MLLIDADEIIEYLDHECEYYAKKYMRFMKDYDVGFHDAIDCVQRKIKNAPTIEAEPVRHGRWLTWEEVFYGDKRASNNIGVFCSMCDKHSDNTTNYCHECGAKMDGGDEDGEC